jgi:hypothetical protein
VLRFSYPVLEPFFSSIVDVTLKRKRAIPLDLIRRNAQSNGILNDSLVFQLAMQT